MQNVVKCLYPKVWRIPEDYISRSILKSEFYQEKHCKIHALKVISGSSLLHFSPFDSALALNLLLEKKPQENSNINFKLHPLYKGAINRLINSIINYRFELLPYFFKKFSELHEVNALRALVTVIIHRDVISRFNTNTLIDLSYLTAHHIPRDCYIFDDFDRISENFILYNKFYKLLLASLFARGEILLNKVLIYKLLYSLAKVPFKLEQSKELSLYLKHKVIKELESDSWEAQHLVGIYWSLGTLGILDSELLSSIYSSIGPIVDYIDTKHLQLALSISSKLDDKLSKKFTELIKDKLQTYSKLGVKWKQRK
ncbi:conserved hypothetical protein [Theileria equi strain WA]|uniref:Uncharacterized protein n=1 Tax=Theileria equi strain WA TaxID=1537102 RepID=L1LDJ9_THEEQ|nr:conserved hypothetical protein [Theileria equi strain WA]EKX73238.1 conserved hypothetical protein [Theileria equi strain WA]|eukprot:XP_004832690.1 conserved hypothetical protein [Theileria equi strain WA]